MLKKNTNSPLCSAKRLGTLCGEKLFLAVSAFRSSDFISRQVKNYGVNKRGVNPLIWTPPIAQAFFTLS